MEKQFCVFRPLFQTRNTNHLRVNNPWECLWLAKNALLSGNRLCRNNPQNEQIHQDYLPTNQVTFAFHKCNYVKIQNLHGKSSNGCCPRHNPPNKTNNNRPPTDTAKATTRKQKLLPSSNPAKLLNFLQKAARLGKTLKNFRALNQLSCPNLNLSPKNPDDPETATENITLSNVKIWSFEKTVIVENATNDIVIIDLTGRVVKNVAPDSNRMEIQLSKGGIYIVKSGLSTKKVSVQ